MNTKITNTIAYISAFSLAGQSRALPAVNSASPPQVQNTTQQATPQQGKNITAHVQATSPQGQNITHHVQATPQQAPGQQAFGQAGLAGFAQTDAASFFTEHAQSFSGALAIICALPAGCPAKPGLEAVFGPMPQPGCCKNAAGYSSLEGFAENLQTMRSAAEKMAETLNGKPGTGGCKPVSALEEMGYTSIVAKLKSGQELSGYELSQLKKKAPGLYAKALAAQQARLQLRSQLQRAKTSKDFRIAQTSIASLAAASAMPAGQQGGGFGGGDVSTRINTAQQLVISHSALCSEYGSYAAARQRINIKENVEANREKQKQFEKSLRRA